MVPRLICIVLSIKCAFQMKWLYEFHFKVYVELFYPEVYLKSRNDQSSHHKEHRYSGLRRVKLCFDKYIFQFLFRYKIYIQEFDLDQLIKIFIERTVLKSVFEF
jgi:hypothetical protein